jgi:YVTN family beta-propeller protein
MKSIALVLTALTVLASFPGWAAEKTPLLIEAKIPLGEVRGRIDHLAIDLRRNHLFVAEVENNSVAVVDLKANDVIHTITGLQGPQGLGYVPSTDTLYVANSGDGSVRLFSGTNFSEVDEINLRDIDADNVRVDMATNQVIVGYGNGALAVIDPNIPKVIADVALKGHPESFRLDPDAKRVFVNDPSNRSIAVIDLTTRRQTASWPMKYDGNFPMALDNDAKHVVIAFRNPAKLGVFSMEDGASVASTDLCSDADDLFVDSKRRQVYVSCGDGFLDVFDTREGQYSRIAHIATSPGARTSLFVPEIDKLFVAARATPQDPATVWVLMPGFENDDGDD